MLIAGARLAVRLIVERPSRGDRAAQARGAGGRRRLRRPDGRPRAAAQPQPRRHRDRLRRRRPAQARDADAGAQGAGLDRGDRHDPRRDRARRGRDRDPLGARARCAARSSPPAASARSASAPCRPCSSCCAAASSSTSSCARSRSRTCSAASRSCVELDRVGAYLRDRIVLVTGAGGSIGSELCRQIARVKPRLLVMLDHAEDNLFQIDREMVEERHFTNVESVLADCKEPHRMLEVMQRFKPDVVFHAAAYKHVPLMEANPLEAVRNNAIATRITAETAAASKVERFVLISTDKAVNPQTVMGASKAMAEWIVEAAGHKHPRHPLRLGPLRQRARLLRQRGADLPQPDRARRPGHRHPPGDDPLLHDDPGGGAAGDPRRRHRRRQGRGLRPRHGRAGEDRRPRPQHDPARRLRARDATSRSSSPGRAPARSCTRSCSAAASSRSRPRRGGSTARCARRRSTPSGSSRR